MLRAKGDIFKMPYFVQTTVLKQKIFSLLSYKTMRGMKGMAIFLEN